MMELKVVPTAEENNHNEDILTDDSLQEDENTVRHQSILTHVIDGFLIEESLSPFAFGMSSVLSTHQLNIIQMRQQQILARERETENEDSNLFAPKEEYTPSKETLATCDRCGFSGPVITFSSTKPPYCSTACARNYPAGHLKRGRLPFRRGSSLGRRGRRMLQSRPFYRRRGRGRGYSLKARELRVSPPPVQRSMSDSSFSESDDCSASSDDGSVFSYSPTSSPEPTVPYDGDIPRRPVHWSVEDVCSYIRSLPDSMQYAEEFRSQEIDGLALLFLHEEHLISFMKLPLGPALKLCAHIDRLRRETM